MKIAIIDDEQDARFVLNRQLQKSDVPISDIQEAEGVLSGYKLVQDFEPDLIFLDIKMYDGTGFDLLRQLDRAYPVIFVTAYDEFAIKAIKHQALDYLLKPVRQDSLNEALQTFQKSMLQRQRQEDLRKSLRSKPIETVIVGNINGFEVLSAADIYFFEGANQYTQVQLKDDTITSSKGLVHYDELLKGSQFIRIHNRHIVNASKIRTYQKGDGGCVTLDNGQTLAVSRKFKANLLDYFGGR